METLLPIHRERDWGWVDSPKNSRRLLEERTWDVNTGRVNVTWTVIDDQGTASSSTSIRMYNVPELRALFEAAGFEGIEVRDGKTGGPFRLGAGRAAIVAGKRREAQSRPIGTSGAPRASLPAAQHRVLGDHDATFRELAK